MPRKRARYSRRRSAKTGRFISSDAPVRAGLTGTLLFRKELLHDFVLYLDAESLLSLCKYMAEAGFSLVLLDAAWWRELLTAHCQVNYEEFTIHRSVTLTQGCSELSDYLSLRSQLERFERCVHVVKGDLGAITTIGDQEVDCLVFPTPSSYRNPFPGVARRVHERAGPDLGQAVLNVHLRNNMKAGSVMCTVGYDSGMRLLVHCVGPLPSHPNSDTTLYKTYVNAFLAVDNSDVECAAVASISTRMYHFPVPRAADIALSAIRDLIRLRPHWNASIAFVCIDDAVFENFERARQDTYGAFHTTGFAYKRLVKSLSMAEATTT